MTAEGDRSDDSSVHYIGWLDGGRYLLEFRKHGAWSRSDANTRIGTVTLWTFQHRCSSVGRAARRRGRRGRRGRRQIIVCPKVRKTIVR